MKEGNIILETCKLFFLNTLFFYISWNLPLFINNNVYSHHKFWCMHGPPKENYVPTPMLLDTSNKRHIKSRSDHLKAFFEDRY